MAKAQAHIKSYPDLSRLFAAKEQARRERAQRSPTEKYRMVQQLNEINKLLKSAKIVKRPGVKRG